MNCAVPMGPTLAPAMPQMPGGLIVPVPDGFAIAVETLLAAPAVAVAPPVPAAPGEAKPPVPSQAKPPLAGEAKPPVPSAARAPGEATVPGRAPVPGEVPVPSEATVPGKALVLGKAKPQMPTSESAGIAAPLGEVMIEAPIRTTPPPAAAVPERALPTALQAEPSVNTPRTDLEEPTVSAHAMGPAALEGVGLSPPTDTMVAEAVPIPAATTPALHESADIVGGRATDQPARDTAVRPKQVDIRYGQAARLAAAKADSGLPGVLAAQVIDQPSPPLETPAGAASPAAGAPVRAGSGAGRRPTSVAVAEEAPDAAETIAAPPFPVPPTARGATVIESAAANPAPVEANWSAPEPGIEMAQAPIVADQFAATSSAALVSALAMSPAPVAPRPSNATGTGDAKQPVAAPKASARSIASAMPTTGRKALAAELQPDFATLTRESTSPIDKAAAQAPSGGPSTPDMPAETPLTASLSAVGDRPAQAVPFGERVALAAKSPALPASQAAAEPVAVARPGQIGHDVGVAIAHRLSAGGEELVVRLVPADLGRIEVRMTFDERAGLRAVIAADSPVALDMLRRDIADLTRSLSDAGVRSDQQSLRFQTESGIAGGGGGNGGGAGGQQRSPWREANASAARDDFTPDAEPIAYRAIRTSGSYNLLA